MMASLTYYAAIEAALSARRRCEEKVEQSIGKPDEHHHWREMVAKHQSTLDRLFDALPSGSGIDSGTELCEEKSTADRLVFTLGFHHMDESGYYVGWSHHTVTVKPGWSGPDVRVTADKVPGRRPLPGGTGWSTRELNDYLAELFQSLTPEDSPLVARAMERPQVH